MPVGRFEVTLVDEHGIKLPCIMNNDQENRFMCGLEDGWPLICRVKILGEGQTVKLSISAQDCTLILFQRMFI